MRGVYIGNNKVLVSMVWGGKLVVSSKDLSLSPDLIIDGVYDVSLTNYLLKNIKRGYTVFDVGANVGCFTVLLGWLVGREGKVISYEADPDVCSLLRDNVAINYQNPQTTIYNKAVYSTRSQVSFFQTERFRGNGSLNKHDSEYIDYFGEERINEIKTEAEPLDIHLSQVENINLIKIDIEGGEYDAFLGMQKLLQNRVVDTVIFELNKRMLAHKWAAFYTLLTELTKLYNAKSYILTENGELVSCGLDLIFARDQVPSVVIKFRE